MYFKKRQNEICEDMFGAVEEVEDKDEEEVEEWCRYLTPTTGMN